MICPAKSHLPPLLGGAGSPSGSTSLEGEPLGDPGDPKFAPAINWEATRNRVINETVRNPARMLIAYANRATDRDRVDRDFFVCSSLHDVVKNSGTTYSAMQCSQFTQLFTELDCILRTRYAHVHLGPFVTRYYPQDLLRVVTRCYPQLHTPPTNFPLPNAPTDAIPETPGRCALACSRFTFHETSAFQNTTHFRELNTKPLSVAGNVIATSNRSKSTTLVRWPKSSVQTLSAFTNKERSGATRSTNNCAVTK